MPSESWGDGWRTTHWSVVLAAAHETGEEGRAALDRFCRVYWYPLYAYLRRRGLAPAESEDLTQSFFAERVVNARLFRGLKEESGRFRPWLLACFRNFVANARARERAAKRGGGAVLVELTTAEGESRFACGGDAVRSPEAEFDRAWALSLIDVVLGDLRSAYRLAGRGEIFEVLEPYLPGGDGAVHAETAQRLGKSVDAVKMAVSRLRAEFGRRLRDEIGRTARGGDVDAEIAHLLMALQA